jgi:hypothetical protein
MIAMLVTLGFEESHAQEPRRRLLLACLLMSMNGSGVVIHQVLSRDVLAYFLLGIREQALEFYLAAE